MTAKPRPKSPLERLQEAGELALLGNRWCKLTAPDDGYEVLSGAEGLILVSEQLATARRRGKYIRLKPVKEPVGR